jgi:hypothetical protein
LAAAGGRGSHKKGASTTPSTKRSKATVPPLGNTVAPSAPTLNMAGASGQEDDVASLKSGGKLKTKAGFIFSREEFEGVFATGHKAAL